MRAAFAHAQYLERMWLAPHAKAARELRELWARAPEAFAERVSLRWLCLLMEQSERLRPAARPPLLRFLKHCQWSEAAHRLIVRTCGAGCGYALGVRACLLLQARAGTSPSVLPLELWRLIFAALKPRDLGVQ